MNEHPEEQVFAMANDIHSLFKRDLNDTELVMCVEHGLPLFGVGTSVAGVMPRRRGRFSLAKSIFPSNKY